MSYRWNQRGSRTLVIIPQTPRENTGTKARPSALGWASRQHGGLRGSIHFDASTLEGYTRAGDSFESHGQAVEQMKLHINEVGKLLAKAREHKKSASPWQATAIDRVDPLLREIAANTESVIRYLNENPKRLALQEFREYVEVSSDSSARKADLIGDFVSYGNSKNRMESLATKLELSSSKR